MEKAGRETPDAKKSAAAEKHTSWKDPWVDALVHNPKEIPDTVLIAGYVGDSPDENAIRVFLDPQLRWIIDVPVAAIAHREPVPRNLSSLGGSYLWINAAAWADCKYHQRRTTCVPAAGQPNR